jgi:uncharacterized damage-inducible protein DinB
MIEEDSMNVPDFYVKTWESEMPAFGRVLRALPQDKLDYRPHERSTAAGDLAWQLVIEQRALAAVAKSGEFPWDMSGKPSTLDGIVEEWDKATADLRQQLAGFDQARADRQVKIMMGENAWSDALGSMLWGFLLDLIHHRGQLSSYIRPMGGKVPSIYGPSGDEAG